MRKAGAKAWREFGLNSRGAESFVHLIFSIAIISSQRGGEERRRCGAEWIEQKKPFPIQRVSQWDEPIQLAGLVQGDAARHPRLPALSVCARRRTRKK